MISIPSNGHLDGYWCLRQENPDLVFLLNRVIQLQKILKSGKRSYATFRYQYMELIFKVGT